MPVRDAEGNQFGSSGFRWRCFNALVSSAQTHSPVISRTVPQLNPPSEGEQDPGLEYALKQSEELQSLVFTSEVLQRITAEHRVWLEMAVATHQPTHPWHAELSALPSPPGLAFATPELVEYLAGSTALRLLEQLRSNISDVLHRLADVWPAAAQLPSVSEMLRAESIFNSRLWVPKGSPLPAVTTLVNDASAMLMIHGEIGNDELLLFQGVAVDNPYDTIPVHLKMAKSADTALKE
eukprot:TRINITY_DN32728_c0_g1_i1.p1 TRINITY_DN32728_c0_g1~~TRINITY_DN32728_c0_g1_i1.p1  ORF type:complete len:237 (-),score=35.26 TRINITY_DN32728_c0_g1_i1:41-751(-)